MADLLLKSATELAGLVRSGEVSSRELVEASLRRIEAVDGDVNAWVHVDEDGALDAADAVAAGDRRPFAGVPIAIKDLFAPVAGLPMTQGADLMGDYVPEHDYALVRRFREAGFVIVGKVNTPEFGIPPVTEPRRNGATRNPWDLERTPGGSSGGSSAAIASGTVPVAHGSDGGGSIRIPAACTGLLGLKPARGRVSHGPDLGDHFLATDGALCRTTEDAAALLDVMAGYEPGDATWAPPPAEPFAAAAAREPRKLRVGLTHGTPIPAEVDPACAQAARDAAALLEELGHEVEEVEAPWAGGDLLQVFSVLWCATTAASVRYAELVAGRPATEDDVESMTWMLFQRGLSFTAPDLVAANTILQGFARGVVSTLWSAYDVVITPALARRPVRIGEIDTQADDPDEQFRASGRFTPFTAVFNVTGQPAISVPLFHGDDGLPLAVQMVGRPAAEATLLSLTGQLEAARPWAERVAPLAEKV
jgi:amidase